MLSSNRVDMTSRETVPGIFIIPLRDEAIHDNIKANNGDLISPGDDHSGSGSVGRRFESESSTSEEESNSDSLSLEENFGFHRSKERSTLVSLTASISKVPKFINDEVKKAGLIFNTPPVMQR